MNEAYRNLWEQLEFINVVTPTGKFNKKSKILLKKSPKILSQLTRLTQFLTEDNYREQDELRARLTCIKNNIVSQPKCKVCGAVVKYNYSTCRFNRYCSNTVSNCANNDEQVVYKRAVTLLERYGVDNPAKDKRVQEKRLNARYPAENNK